MQQVHHVQRLCERKEFCLCSRKWKKDSEAETQRKGKGLGRDQDEAGYLGKVQNVQCLLRNTKNFYLFKEQWKASEDF